MRSEFYFWDMYGETCFKMLICRLYWYYYRCVLKISMLQLVVGRSALVYGIKVSRESFSNLDLVLIVHSAVSWSQRTRTVGCCWNSGTGTEPPEMTLWAHSHLGFPKFSRTQSWAGTSSSLRRRASSTMFLFLRKGRTCSHSKIKCG